MNIIHILWSGVQRFQYVGHDATWSVDPKCVGFDVVDGTDDWVMVRGFSIGVDHDTEPDGSFPGEVVVEYGVFNGRPPDVLPSIVGVAFLAIDVDSR